MLYLIMASAISGNFSVYPGFVTPGQTLEAIIDRGPIVELIVRCERGTGILSYSKLDRAFCVPDMTCYTTLDRAMAKLCRQAKPSFNPE